MKKLETGGTADSAENGGANIGGTLGSSIMKKGGSLKGKQKNLDLNKNGKLDSEDFKMIRGKMKTGGGLKVNLGSGEMDLEDAIKMYEAKIKSQGRVTNERDENMLKQLKNMRTKHANGGGLADVPESFPETDAMSYKNGGTSDSDFERDYKKVKQHIKEGYGNIDSGYVETTWENMSNITYSAIEDKLIKRLKKDGLFNYANGGSIKGFEYSIGGL